VREGGEEKGESEEGRDNRKTYVCVCLKVTEYLHNSWDSLLRSLQITQKNDPTAANGSETKFVAVREQV